MKIVFFGTPGFAAYNLQYLIDQNYQIDAVVTGLDKLRGRGKKKLPTEVKKTAIDNNIPVLQPQNLNDTSFIYKLNELKADIFLVVAFKYLPEKIWRLPKIGSINLHTSLLPNYRGAAPINRVLINGEKNTGITTFYLNKNIDQGNILKQKKIDISENMTAGQLHEKLKKEGAILIKDTFNDIISDSIFEKKQNSSKTLMAPKLTKEMLRIDWKQSALDIHNLVRGLSPYISENKILKDVSICPSAWFMIKEKNGVEKRVKLQLTTIKKSQKKYNFKVETDNKTYLNIIISEMLISLLQLQVEGKKSISIHQFLNGYDLKSLEIL